MTFARVIIRQIIKHVRAWIVEHHPEPELSLICAVSDIAGVDIAAPLDQAANP